MRPDKWEKVRSNNSVRFFSVDDEKDWDHLYIPQVILDTTYMIIL